MRFEEFFDEYTRKVYAEFGSFGEGPLPLEQLLYKEALYSYVEQAIAFSDSASVSCDNLFEACRKELGQPE